MHSCLPLAKSVLLSLRNGARMCGCLNPLRLSAVNSSPQGHEITERLKRHCAGLREILLNVRWSCSCASLPREAGRACKAGARGPAFSEDRTWLMLVSLSRLLLARRGRIGDRPPRSGLLFLERSHRRRRNRDNLVFFEVALIRLPVREKAIAPACFSDVACASRRAQSCLQPP